MLKSIKKLIGAPLGVADGEVGHVKDMYFDDQDWAIRYVVADTGSWLPGRMILLAPHALGRISDKKALTVHLTRKQIEHSPSIDMHKPVSRQFEEEYYRYYNWPFYWQGGALWGVSDFPILPPNIIPSERPVTVRERRKSEVDAHLRSAKAVVGYHIQGRDDTFGHVADFLVDDESWAIDHVVVETGSWLSGKKVLISPFEIEKIDWAESKIVIDSTKRAIENAPAYEPAHS